jgi:hypothetical protein
MSVTFGSQKLKVEMVFSLESSVLGPRSSVFFPLFPEFNFKTCYLPFRQSYRFLYYQRFITQRPF